MGTSRSTDIAGPCTAGVYLYSGRADPAWRLAEAEVSELVDAWERLQPSVVAPGKRPRLGYSGSWMIDATGRRWHAFDGRARLSTREGELLKIDPDRAFERKIVDSAPSGLLPNPLPDRFP